MAGFSENQLTVAPFYFVRLSVAGSRSASRFEIASVDTPPSGCSSVALPETFAADVLGAPSLVAI